MDLHEVPNFGKATGTEVPTHVLEFSVVVVPEFPGFLYNEERHVKMVCLK